jgi:3-oxoadipate enol-lactonase
MAFSLTVVLLGLLISFLCYQSHWSERSILESFTPYKYYPSLNSDSSETIIIIPGLDGCASFFADSLPHITSHGYNVLVFNLPLAGPSLESLSDWHRANYSEYLDYSFPFIAQKLQEIIEEFQWSKVHIIGESFGGVVAQHYAFLYPEHLDKLVVLSSLAKTELTPEVQFKANYALPVVRFIGWVSPRFAQWLFAVIHQYDVVEDSEPQWIHDFFVKEASWAHHYSVMRRLDIVLFLDIVKEVKKIKAPTLLLYGEDDTFTKQGSLMLKKLIPNSELQSLPGGHLPHLSSPKLFSDVVVGFLKK